MRQNTAFSFLPPDLEATTSLTHGDVRRDPLVRSRVHQAAYGAFADEIPGDDHEKQSRIVESPLNLSWHLHIDQPGQAHAGVERRLARKSASTSILAGRARSEGVTK